MKRISQEIIEAYEYNSFAEFEEHYEQMLKEGYKPHSATCNPKLYQNFDLDSYFAQYYRK